MPGTLRDTYVNILERITPSDWELSRKALFWLSFAKRSLTLRELNEAVVLEETCTVFDDDLELVSPRILLQICQGLITQDESGRVNLAHVSIKDFLTSEWIRSSSVQYFSLDHATADKTIMRHCLTYLCLDNFRSGYECSIDLIAAREHERPFLEYAAQFWATHGGSCDFDGHDCQLINKLFDSRYLPHRGNFGVWVQTLVPEVDIESIETTQPLYYAASYGLVPVVKAILASEPPVDVDARGGRFRSTPLFVACWRGNYEVAELLLQAGADPYLVDPGSDSTVFSLLKRRGFSRLQAILPKSPGNLMTRDGGPPVTYLVQYANQGSDAGRTR
jgi:ankyrin repeat protein